MLEASVKKVRKYIQMLIVICLCFNASAAVVGDNDGSAFITKAEFDSLKNNFQSQIDQYNTSIDNKIDAAIASYLSGINIAKTITSDIIMRNWEEVTCYNGSFAPTYDLPSINVGYTYIHCWPRSMETAGGANNRNGFWNIAIMLTYTNPKTNYVYRPLVTGNKETSQTTNMVWNGIAYKYMESWDVAKSNIQTNGTWLMWLDGPTQYDYGGILKASLRFNPSGYYSTVDAALACWTPSLFWRYRAKTSTGPWATQNITIYSANDITSVGEFKVELVKSGDKTTFHDHIVEYDGSKTWKVSNETFTKTFRLASNKTSTDLYNASTKSGLVANYGILTMVGWALTYSNQRFRATNASSYYNSGGSTSNPETEDITATTLPCIGMLSSDQEARNIYQYKDRMTISFDGKDIILEKQTLEKGFPLFYVEDGMDVSWEPEFSKYCKSTSGGWVEQDDKVKLYLSYGPFTDLASTSNPVEFTTKNHSAKATSQIMDLTGDKVSFKSTKDDIIYAKWVPNTTTYASDIWYSTLNLANCSQYRYTKKDEN